MARSRCPGPRSCSREPRPLVERRRESVRCSGASMSPWAATPWRSHGLVVCGTSGVPAPPDEPGDRPIASRSTASCARSTRRWTRPAQLRGDRERPLYVLWHYPRSTPTAGRARASSGSSGRRHRLRLRPPAHPGPMVPGRPGHGPGRPLPLRRRRRHRLPAAPDRQPTRTISVERTGRLRRPTSSSISNAISASAEPRWEEQVAIVLRGKTRSRSSRSSISVLGMRPSCQPQFELRTRCVEASWSLEMRNDATFLAPSDEQCIPSLPFFTSGTGKEHSR